MKHESLARKLRVLRAARGITLAEAEELTGVTRETLGALEHGQRGAYTSTLEKIANGYGTTISALMAEDEPEAALAGAQEEAEASKTGLKTEQGSAHWKVDEKTFKTLAWALTGEILDDLEDEAYEEATGKVRKMRELLSAS